MTWNLNQSMWHRRGSHCASREDRICSWFPSPLFPCCHHWPLARSLSKPCYRRLPSPIRYIYAEKITDVDSLRTAVLLRGYSCRCWHQSYSHPGTIKRPHLGPCKRQYDWCEYFNKAHTMHMRGQGTLPGYQSLIYQVFIKTSTL